MYGPMYEVEVEVEVDVWYIITKALSKPWQFKNRIIVGSILVPRKWQELGGGLRTRVIRQSWKE